MARGRALNGARPAPGAGEERASEALVSRALELRDAGRSDWLDVACAARPELRDAVRAAVERVCAVPELLARGTAADPMVGRELGGRFRLVERIGAGAMGVVYLAEDRELGRDVACKVVRHGLMPPAQALERFAREARSMAAVQHPSVAVIHDRGRTEDEQVYLVMELVDGTALSELLDDARRRLAEPPSDANAWIEERFGIARRGESSWIRTAVRWTAELAQGLETVHRAGILHRDVKPSNVRVRRDGRPALLDFGIALLDDAESITRTPTSLGTPAYMPPEALTREGRRTRASDVYGLTATLYHMLTLSAPYEGTPADVLHALATREPMPAARRRPGLPRDLQAILDKGMHRRPSARYASAADLEADLRAFLEFRPVAARPVNAIERVARGIGRSRAAQGALAALAIVALGGGAVVVARAASERASQTRRARHADAMIHLPPSLGLVGVHNRVVRDPADRARIEELLDAVVETADEPVPARVLRASFRQDHGDPRGAAEDMATVAEVVATPLARELGALYARASSSSDVDPSALPEPARAIDRFLLAYHWMRREEPARARPLLASAEVRALSYAEELHLLATPFEAMEPPERMRVAVERYADLVRLESRIGARTATTAHVAGRLLMNQRRFDEAQRAAEESIELAPYSHVARVNAGMSAFFGRRLDEARRHLEAARALRPGYAKIVENLVWVEVAGSRFDAAEELVRRSAPELRPPTPAWPELWLGTIATYAALDAHDRGDGAERMERLAQAQERFARVRELVGDERYDSNDTAVRTAGALESGDERVLVIALADLLREEPGSWWRRALLSAHWPDALDAEASAAVHRAYDASR